MGGKVQSQNRDWLVHRALINTDWFKGPVNNLQGLVPKACRKLKSPSEIISLQVKKHPQEMVDLIDEQVWETE